MLTHIGEENILATSGRIFLWEERGVWKEKSEDIFKKKILEVLGVGTKKHIIDQLSERIRIVTSLEDHKFNQDTLVVNCTNGELHLDNQTGGITMHSHNRESYSTVQLPVNYDPAAIAPRFKKFLDEVFENDPDKEQKKLCIYQMIGYCLIREQRYDTFFMLVGCGANGKSVLCKIIIKLLGSENVSKVSPRHFGDRFRSSALFGKLANITTELGKNSKLPDEFIKAVTSQDEQQAEAKYKDPFDYIPFATTMFATNHLPHTSDDSDGIYRRARILEFNEVFGEDRRDDSLIDTLKDELSGILNLALQGLQSIIQNGGIVRPPSSEVLLRQWREENDHVSLFVSECCIVGSNTKDQETRARVNNHAEYPRSIYDAYKYWCDKVHIEKPFAHSTLSKQLKRLGVITGKKVGTERVSFGIRVRSSVRAKVAKSNTQFGSYDVVDSHNDNELDDLIPSHMDEPEDIKEGKKFESGRKTDMLDLFTDEGEQEYEDE